MRPRAPVSMVAARNLEHSDLGAGLLLRTVPLITEQATRRFGVGGKLVNRTDGVVAVWLQLHLKRVSTGKYLGMYEMRNFIRADELFEEHYLK